MTERILKTRRELFADGARLGAGVATIAISARALGLSPASAKVPDKIVIGQLPFNTEVTIYAQAGDFFKEEGLSIEYSLAAGGPAAVQALAAGSIPVGDIGVGPALIAASRGLPLVSPALGAIGTPTQPVDRIMTYDGSPIRSVADLKGKRFALHQKGSMEDLELLALKKTHGIGPDDLEITLIPAANQPQVLAEKQVDAAFAVPPFDTIAERKFEARTIINGADFVPYVGYGTLTFRTDFLEAYPDAGKHLMKAWMRVCRWIDDNKQEANLFAGKKIGIVEDIRPYVRLPYFARNGLPSMPNVWHLYYMLVAGKVLEPLDNPEKLMAQSVVEPTKRYALPALDELGAQPDPEFHQMNRASFPLLPKPVEAYYAGWEN